MQHERKEKMDRIYELTYLCGCGKGQNISRASYERHVQLNGAVPFEYDVAKKMCDKCRSKPTNLNNWSWKTVAPKRRGARPGGEFDEMMCFLTELAPPLDVMSVADIEVVVNRVTSQLRIDGFQLYNKRGEIDADAVSEGAKGYITKLVCSQMEQVQRQHQEQQHQKEVDRARATSALVEDAVCVDVRRFKNHEPARVVDCKSSKADAVSVGGVGFF